MAFHALNVYVLFPFDWTASGRLSEGFTAIIQLWPVSREGKSFNFSKLLSRSIYSIRPSVHGRVDFQYRNSICLKAKQNNKQFQISISGLSHKDAQFNGRTGAWHFTGLRASLEQRERNAHNSPLSPEAQHLWWEVRCSDHGECHSQTRLSRCFAWKGKEVTKR